MLVLLSAFRPRFARVKLIPRTGRLPVEVGRSGAEMFNGLDGPLGEGRRSGGATVESSGL